jgi:hypothetical protein
MARKKRAAQLDPPLRNSNGNDIETKAEQSFDLDFVFDIEVKRTSLFQTCKDRSEVNPAYSTP